MKTCRSATNLLVSTISAAASKLSPGTISSVVAFGTWTLKKENFVDGGTEVTQLDLAIKLQQNLKLIGTLCNCQVGNCFLTMAATLYGHMVLAGDQCSSVTVASWNATDRVNAQLIDFIG